jgi:soluble lytic murein transglycosylase-like protein
MKLFSKFMVLIISIFTLTLFLGWYAETRKIETVVNNMGEVSKDAPPSIQLYNYILKYSSEYDVPQDIAFGVANHETGYRGPFHWKYNPRLTSSANAYGAMQIQVPTANHFSDNKITKDDLLNDLELNVELSMRILSYLKNKYKSWELALGAYNTGRPMVNSYASSIVKFNAKKEFAYD